MSLYGDDNATYQYRVAKMMELIGDMSARQALAKGLVRKCPACGTLHPGIRYTHDMHKDFCSAECFRNRPAAYRHRRR